MITNEQLASLTQKEMFDLLWRLEQIQDVRLSVVTRDDVNGIFQSACETEGLPVRDLTDSEWSEFKEDWFWRKGFSDIFWDGDVSLAVTEDLLERNLFQKTVTA